MAKGKDDKEPVVAVALPVTSDTVHIRARSTHGKTRIHGGIWFGPNWTEHDVSLELLEQIDKDTQYMQVEYTGKVVPAPHEPTQIEMVEHDKQIGLLQGRIRELVTQNLKALADEREKSEKMLAEVRSEFAAKVAGLENQLKSAGLLNEPPSKVFPPEMDEKQDPKRAPKDKDKK